MLTRQIFEQHDVAEPAEVLGHDDVAACVKVLHNRGACEIARDASRRFVVLPVRQRHLQRVDLDECRAVMVVDIPASERGLARRWRSVDENQPCDASSLLTAVVRAVGS